jgi:hypothetical protein
MSWKKHFQVVPSKKLKASTAMSGLDDRAYGAGTGGKFASWLPEVYSGQGDRIARYTQYDQMDMDSEINAALDTIADFCTQIEDNEDQPFEIVYHEEPTETETELLETALRKWVKLNDFRRRIWKVVRNTIKYGDQFFIRDPETYELMWVDHAKVQSIVVNEAEGKEPQEYLIKDLDLNIMAKTATALRKDAANMNGAWPSQTGAEPLMGGGSTLASTPIMQTRFGGGHNEQVVPVAAEHVVHLSLSEGMDQNWPFGNSILESVFKVYKQKELLEDAMIIYRVQRAPERRVFYVDVGNMPAHKAMAYVERIKNEIHQRRIPNRTGGGASILDAAYNPMAIIEDYFFAQSAEGRGSKVETLPAGENLGEIDDVKYFSNKLFRALRIPTSYLPTGPEDGTAQVSDGRVGTAYIQEWRFSKYCQRLQNVLAPMFDMEFKLFLKRNGIEIHPTIYEIAFHEPQNFGEYKRMEIDSQRLGLYGQVSQIPWISKRYGLIKYAGWTEDEVLENEKYWAAENASKVKDKSGKSGEDKSGGLRDVGIGGGGGGFDMGMGDMDMGDEGGDMDMTGGESPISGGEGASGGDTGPDLNL